MKSAQYHEIVRAAKSYKRFKISQHQDSGGSFEDKVALIKVYSEDLGNYFHKGMNVIGCIDITLREGRFRQLKAMLGLK
jgi:16S rRNA U516 pseudouridylate synthase RsuA-like enzyme